MIFNDSLPLSLSDAKSFTNSYSFVNIGRSLIVTSIICSNHIAIFELEHKFLNSVELKAYIIGSIVEEYYLINLFELLENNNVTLLNSWLKP